MNIISIKNLIKRIDNKIVIDNINLTIKEGDLFGLVGPNGAGKSTTLKLLSGSLKKDNGTIMIDNKDIKHTKEIRKILGIVPEEIAIYDNITVYDNIKFFASLYGVKARTHKHRIDEILDFLELKEYKNQKPKKFSNGMKRSLNIACSIIHNPKILLMDEPTVGIDTKTRKKILNLLRDLNKNGTTIIYTSHYMNEVEQLCNIIGIIDKGKLIAYGSKEELKSISKIDDQVIIETDKINQNINLSINNLKGIINTEQIDNKFQITTINARNSLNDIVDIFNNSNIKIKDIKVIKPNLEDVFLHLTGRNLETLI